VPAILQPPPLQTPRPAPPPLARSPLPPRRAALGRVDTLPCVQPEDVDYVDFSEEGARLAAELRGEGRADLVVALTHMREPNDVRLAEGVPGIDLVLG
jgi:hypothetical protein